MEWNDCLFCIFSAHLLFLMERFKTIIVNELNNKRSTHLYLYK